MSRRRARRNPLGLSTTEMVAGGVAAVALVAGGGYLLLRKSTPASASGGGGAAPGGGSCWQPAASPFTLTPGHYRLEVTIPAAKQPSLPSQWTSIGQSLAALGQQFPGLVVEGAWAGTLAYPSGAALPSDWPTAPNPNVLRLQLSNAYSTAGTPYASKALPVGLSVWSCTTGPFPAQQPLPANLVAVFASLAAASSSSGSVVAKAPPASIIAG